jgi:hypothetical protein
LSRDFALMTTVRRLAHSPLSYTNFDEHSIFFHNKTINTVTSKTYLTTHYATRITHPQRSTHNAHLSSSSPQPDDFVATMSTSPQNKDCPLLEMPIETLQRITDLLDTHGDLPSVGLTCKTLDYVTLERFVSASFSTVKCCIFYESRWIRLMKIVSGPSRITRKIQKIDLTTCFFEDRDPSEIRLAPRKPSPNHTITALTNPYYKAFKAHNKAEAVAVQHLPNLALMSCVLRDIEKVFPPGVVTLYLIESQHCPNRYIDAHRDALFTLASAHSLRLYGLCLNQDAIWGLGEIFAHQRRDLLRCISGLKNFKLSPARGDFRGLGGADHGTLDLTPFNHAYQILRSAKKLRVLHLDLSLVRHLATSTTVARRFLEASISSNIMWLTLSSVMVEEKDLSKALSRWAPVLRRVTLSEVSLHSMHKGWPDVFRTLAAMPKLNYLYL